MKQATFEHGTKTLPNGNGGFSDLAKGMPALRAVTHATLCEMHGAIQIGAIVHASRAARRLFGYFREIERREIMGITK